MKKVFQRVVYMVAGLALGLDALALVDFVLHPLATDHTFHSAVYRGIAVLVLLPLNLMIAFLVIKRVPGNIDRIIRRTLAYSILSVIISMIYFSIIFTLQTLFTSLFHATTNTLAIVLSTLVIAALFNRLRGRIQTQVDRRFFRKRYDAERILADFSVTTRRGVAVEPIAGELLRSIEETMQPEEASLWLHRMGEIPRIRREV